MASRVIFAFAGESFGGDLLECRLDGTGHAYFDLFVFIHGNEADLVRKHCGPGDGRGIR